MGRCVYLRTPAPELPQKDVAHLHAHALVFPRKDVTYLFVPRLARLEIYSTIGILVGGEMLQIAYIFSDNSGKMLIHLFR